MQINAKDTDDLDFRRFRILSKLNEQLPYSFKTLELQLQTLCGEDGYKMMLRNENYTLIVRIGLTVKNQFDEVNNTLRRYVPANIVIDLSLLYNTYKELERYTYLDLREEVLTHVNTN